MKPSGPRVAPTKLTVFNGKSKNEPTTTDKPIQPKIQIAVIAKIAM
jgi:hypothetical protein